MTILQWTKRIPSATDLTLTLSGTNEDNNVIKSLTKDETEDEFQLDNNKSKRGLKSSNNIPSGNLVVGSYLHLRSKNYYQTWLCNTLIDPKNNPQTIDVPL